MSSVQKKGRNLPWFWQMMPATGRVRACWNIFIKNFKPVLFRFSQKKENKINDLWLSPILIFLFIIFGQVQVVIYYIMKKKIKKNKLYRYFYCFIHWNFVFLFFLRCYFVFIFLFIYENNWQSRMENWNVETCLYLMLTSSLLPTQFEFGIYWIENEFLTTVYKPLIIFHSSNCQQWKQICWT